MRVSLNELLRAMNDVIGSSRDGDVRDSQTGISRAQRLLGYVSTVPLESGLRLTLDWYRVSSEAGR